MKILIKKKTEIERKDILLDDIKNEIMLEEIKEKLKVNTEEIE